MDTVCRPVQTAKGFHAVSPTMIRAVRPLSQISDSSSGLSLNFSGTSEENLNYTHDHGMHQPRKSQSLLELTQTEPLTMDPPENLDTLPNHVAGDVYNVMNPIPMFTDLQSSNSHFRRLHSSAREEIRADYIISVPYDTTEFSGFIEPTASTSGTASVNLPESSIINLYHSVPNIRASNEIEKLYSSEDVPITKETLETTNRYTDFKDLQSQNISAQWFWEDREYKYKHHTSNPEYDQEHLRDNLPGSIESPLDEQDEQNRSTARVPLEPVIIIHDVNTDDGNADDHHTLQTVNTASESQPLIDQAHHSYIEFPRYEPKVINRKCKEKEGLTAHSYVDLGESQSDEEKTLAFRENFKALADMYPTTKLGGKRMCSLSKS